MSEQSLQFEWQEVDDQIAAEWYVRLQSRATAEAAWQEVQRDRSAVLGQKALAAIARQEAQIAVAAFERFHELPASDQPIDK